MRLTATELTDAERALQRDVRAWLDERLPEGSFLVGLGMVGAFDPSFSRDLGAQGWLGMNLPKEYGGGGRTAVERLVVVEELLARGAPVGFHWVADRQSGPSIALHGTEEQKREFLPKIAKGEISFAIGMSEPDSGSDLASISSRAEPVEATADREAGWVINGSKIWTSGAHLVDYILGLFRTGEDRHAGLTQFIIDRETPGLTIEPIEFIDGEQHFCLLTFVDVFVPDTRRLGEVGWGWMQNQGELVLERGGVDRWMSAMPVLQRWVAHQETKAAAGSTQLHADLASITARCWAFHGMSLAVARMVDASELPQAEAALVKDMATRFEQECVEIVVRHLGRMPSLDAEDEFEELLARATLDNPSWTIRGGTTEVLHNLIAKELRKAESSGTGSDDLAAMVDQLFADKVPHATVVAAEKDGGLHAELWRSVAQLGLPWIGITEDAGGEGGSIGDLVTLLEAAGRYAVPLPLLENHLACWLIASAGGRIDAGEPMSVAGPHGVDLRVEDGRVTGTLRDVAWGATVARVVAPTDAGVAVLDPADAEVVHGRDLAGQPRDELRFSHAPVSVLGSVDPFALAGRGAVLRAAQLAGAMRAVYDLTNSYVYERVQFGRPVGTFQSVRRHLVFLAQAAVMTSTSARRAASALEDAADASFACAAAKLVANQNAALSAKSGHQAHGAIGMTREYALQDFTRRLAAWRGDWGTEAALGQLIGGAVLDTGRIATAATDAAGVIL